MTAAAAAAAASAIALLLLADRLCPDTETVGTDSNDGNETGDDDSGDGDGEREKSPSLSSLSKLCHNRPVRPTAASAAGSAHECSWNCHTVQPCSTSVVMT